MFLLRLVACVFMTIYGILVLFYPDIYWRLWVFGYQMSGFKPDALERSEAWDCQRVAQGVLFLTLGILGLGILVF